MRKFSLVLIVAIFTFSACKKENAQCNYKNSNLSATTAESDSIQRYINAQGLSAIKDPVSGIYYTIGSSGSGATPGLCSYITLTYNGFLFTNTSFTGGNQNGNFSLGELIIGWQKGLPFIKAGGNITLYIPPSLAYGSSPRYDGSGNVVIPANSYLKFVISLTEVQ